jgi:hypothetical protein
MRNRNLFSAFIFFVIIISCKGNGSDFSLEIKNFEGAAGITIYYLVTDKSVQVDYDCDLQDCKRKTLYKRNLNKQQSDSIYPFIRSLRLDSLKAEYKPNGMVFDGLVSYVKLSGSGLPTKSVTLFNQNTPATDALFKFVFGLVPNKFHHF